MIYNMTAADVATYATQRALWHESRKDPKKAEDEFDHAISKAKSALTDPENQDSNILFKTYFEYGAFLYRNRRFVDAHIAFLSAEQNHKQHTDASYDIRQEICRMETEIHRVVKYYFSV